MSDIGMKTEPDYLTVKELADLLRLKERKVYDLAASGEVPCSRVTGKLLFPRKEIQSWIGRGQSGGTQTGPRPAVFLGSHDPLLEWALRHSRCGLATFFDGSLDGLARLRGGEGVAAGLHVYDAGSDSWNIPLVEETCADKNFVLIAFAKRQRGLVVSPNLSENIKDVRDLAGKRVAERQPESGTARLVSDLLDIAGLTSDAYVPAISVRTELEAVQAVLLGEADATFGLEPLARQFGLGFLPVIEERFDLLIDCKSWFNDGLQDFAAFCQSKAFQARAQSEAGYDVSCFGDVRWNG